MRYLILFESYKKADSVLSKWGNKLTKSQLEYIDHIRKTTVAGYVGKLTELYLSDILNYQEDSREQVDWIMSNIIKDKPSKPIDSYASLPQIKSAINTTRTIKLLNKIKKNNSINYDANLEKVAETIIKLDLDLSKIVKLPVHGKVYSDQDFLDLLSGSFIENLERHKDWDILYEDNDLLIYEILSYEGGVYLSHVNHCIRHEHMYNSYKRSGFRFFNIIDKKNIDNSIFIDKNKDIRYDVFSWNDNNIGTITDGKLSTNSTSREVRYKIDLFIEKVIPKIS